MAKRAGQKLKILYLAKIFTEYTDRYTGLTLAEISEKLSLYGIEAERKTLYDDIATLCEFGMDIEKSRDTTVKYYLASRNFELAELKLLVDAVQSSKFITRKKSAQLILKLEGLLSHNEAKALSRQVYVSGRIKTMNESIYYSVDDIHSAIFLNKQISFKYFDWNVKKEKELRHGGKLYTASPFALTWDNENYYLIAYENESQKLKHFRVDKMLGINLLDLKREGLKEFETLDMATYSNRTFGMYGGKETTVTLSCKNSLAGRIIDRFGTDIMIIPDKEERFTVPVKVNLSPLFYTWIMNFGEDIKIISPKEAVEGFVATAKAALKQYENITMEGLN